ncbi:signal recognition particle receptor subunit alpha, partial [Candidatus Hakubella thermalkaliphila]
MTEKILLDRLKQALTRSRRNLSETLNIIISRFKSVDESIWEEIEEGLILADIGVATTLYLI